MRIADVPSANKAIYDHNDMDGSQHGAWTAVPQDMERVVVIFDGIFSMRGDCAPIDQIVAIAGPYQEQIQRRRRSRWWTIPTASAPSDRTAAARPTTRGRSRTSSSAPSARPSGSTAGFIAASRDGDRGGPPEGGHLHLHQPPECRRLRGGPAGGRSVRQPGRPIAPGPCAGHGGSAFVGGSKRWAWNPSPARIRSCRCSCATRPAPTPWCSICTTQGVLVVGLTYPVVPRGDETIRFQINAAHTEADIDHVLKALATFTG